jgi:hypothetical protein
MVAVIVERRDVDTTDDIPVEIRARVEANALFDALRTGDYASAAVAQERLRDLGWYVGREPAPRRHVTRRKARREADGRGVAQ